MPMGNSLLRGISVLAGIGGLAFSFFLFHTWPGMTGSPIAQLVPTIQSDSVVQAGMVAQRACVLDKTESLRVIADLKVRARSTSAASNY